MEDGVPTTAKVQNIVTVTYLSFLTVALHHEDLRLDERLVAHWIQARRVFRKGSQTRHDEVGRYLRAYGSQRGNGGGLTEYLVVLLVRLGSLNSDWLGSQILNPFHLLLNSLAKGLALDLCNTLSKQASDSHPNHGVWEITPIQDPICTSG